MTDEQKGFLIAGQIEIEPDKAFALEVSAVSTELQNRLQRAQNLLERHIQLLGAVIALQAIKDKFSTEVLELTAIAIIFVLYTGLMAVAMNSSHVSAAAMFLRFVVNKKYRMKGAEGVRVWDWDHFHAWLSGLPSPVWKFRGLTLSATPTTVVLNSFMAAVSVAAYFHLAKLQGTYGSLKHVFIDIALGISLVVYFYAVARCIAIRRGPLPFEAKILSADPGDGMPIEQ